MSTSSAAISIYTDLLFRKDQLMADLAESKSEMATWAQDIGNTPINIPFVADMGQLESTLQAFREVQQANPITIPVVLDATSAMDQLVAMRSFDPGVYASAQSGGAGAVDMAGTMAAASATADAMESAGGAAGMYAGMTAAAGAAAEFMSSSSGGTGAAGLPFNTEWGPNAEWYETMQDAESAGAGESAGGAAVGMAMRPFMALMGARMLYQDLASYEKDNDAINHGEIGKHGGQDFGEGDALKALKAYQDEHSGPFHTLARESREFATWGASVTGGNPDPIPDVDPGEQALRDAYDDAVMKREQSEADKKADEAQHRKVEHNEASLHREGEELDKSIAEYRTPDPLDRKQASADEALKKSLETANQIESSWKEYAETAEEAKKMADDLRAKAGALHGEVTANIGRQRDDRDIIQGATERYERAELQGDVVGERKAMAETAVEREYEKISIDEGLDAANKWMTEVGQPTIDRAGSGTDETIKNIAASRQRENIKQQADDALIAATPGRAHEAERNEYVRRQNEELATVHERMSREKDMDVPAYRRDEKLAGEMRSADATELVAYDRHYEEDENLKYQHLQVAGEQALLRSTGQGATANVLGLREDVAKLQRETGGDPAKMAIVNAYATAEATAMRKTLTDSAPSQYGLSGEGVHRFFQEQIDRGPEIKSAMHAIDSFQSDVNHTKDFGGVIPGTDGGFGADFKQAAKDIQEAAKAIANAKQIYVVQN